MVAKSTAAALKSLGAISKDSVVAELTAATPKPKKTIFRALSIKTYSVGTKDSASVARVKVLKSNTGTKTAVINVPASNVESLILTNKGKSRQMDPSPLLISSALVREEKKEVVRTLKDSGRTGEGTGEHNRFASLPIDPTLLAKSGEASDCLVIHEDVYPCVFEGINGHKDISVHQEPLHASIEKYHRTYNPLKDYDPLISFRAVDEILPGENSQGIHSNPRYSDSLGIPSPRLLMGGWSLSGSSGFWQGHVLHQ